MALMSLVRKHVERLYTDICDIWEYTQTVDGSGITCFDELQVQQQLPCRLNYYTSTSTGEGKAASVSQDILLFLSPDIIVKPGSKLVVNKSGIVTVYKNSGEPAIYETHQEIRLTLFKGWA